MTRGPARKALGLILAAAAILLFLPNLRRTGVRAGRAAEQLDAREKTMPSLARCSTPPHAALLIAMLWQTGGAMAGSDTRVSCPPVVEYTADDQACAANEVEALPESAVIVRMLGDYVVLRD